MQKMDSDLMKCTLCQIFRDVRQRHDSKQTQEAGYYCMNGEGDPDLRRGVTGELKEDVWKNLNTDKHR